MCLRLIFPDHLAVNYDNMVVNRQLYSPSLDMPTAMHFLSLQYWHRFLFILRMEHCWFLVHGLYWIFCWMERLKKPCNEERESSHKQPIVVRPRAREGMEQCSLSRGTQGKTKVTHLAREVGTVEHTNWLTLRHYSLWGGSGARLARCSLTDWAPRPRLPPAGGIWPREGGDSRPSLGTFNPVVRGRAASDLTRPAAKVSGERALA